MDFILDLQLPDDWCFDGYGVFFCLPRLSKIEGGWISILVFKRYDQRQPATFTRIDSFPCNLELHLDLTFMGILKGGGFKLAVEKRANGKNNDFDRMIDQEC